MSKFLFTNLWSDDLGLPTRTVPIAEELVKRGHDVTFCNPLGSPSTVIKEAGLNNIVPDLHHIPTEFAPQTPEVWNIDHFSCLTGILDEAFVRDSIRAILEIIKDFGAEAVVDSWNLSACIAARVVRKPLVTIIQGNMHPANRGFIWWKDPPNEIPTPIQTINRILSDYGLASTNNTAELLIGDLILCVGTPETDPVPETENVIHIGPIFCQKSEETLPDWIDALDKDRPLVWVYSGNPRYGAVAAWADSIVVLRSSREALANEDIHVIMTTGHHNLPEELLPLPDNFRHELFIPGLLLAERSDLIIHHGGHGSCMTGAYTGTPAVIIPTYSERENNARRIAALGAAEILVPVTNDSGEKEVSAVELRNRIKGVLNEPSFTQNARKISEKMQTYGGSAEAARLIEDFV